MPFFRCFLFFMFLIRVLHCLYRRDIRSGGHGPNTRYAAGMARQLTVKPKPTGFRRQSPQVGRAKSSFPFALANQFEISEWLSIHGQTGGSS